MAASQRTLSPIPGDSRTPPPSTPPENPLSPRINPPKQVYVNAYGRSFTVDCVDARSNFALTLTALQRQVEAQLGSNGQILCFRDTGGCLIASDEELMQAVMSARVPLQASFSEMAHTDSAIHTLETKRDEIALMQWAVIREQFSALQSQIDVLVTDLSNVKSEMVQQKTTWTKENERLGMDMKDIVAIESASRLNEQSVMYNRIDALAQNMLGEQSAREMLTVTLQKQMECERDEIAAEKQLREAEFFTLKEELEDQKEALKKEAKQREKNYETSRQELICAQDAVEEVARSIREQNQDVILKFSQVSNDIGDSSRAFQNQLNSFQMSIDGIKSDAKKRHDSLEERFLQHHEGSSKSVEQKTQAILNLSRRNENLASEMEQERSERKKLQVAHQRISDLVEALGKALEQNSQGFLQLSQRTEAVGADVASERTEREVMQNAMRRTDNLVESLVEHLQRIEKESSTGIDRERSVRQMQSRSLSSVLRTYSRDGKNQAKENESISPRSGSVKIEDTTMSPRGSAKVLRQSSMPMAPNPTPGYPAPLSSRHTLNHPPANAHAAQFPVLGNKLSSQRSQIQPLAVAQPVRSRTPQTTPRTVTPQRRSGR